MRDLPEVGGNALLVENTAVFPLVLVVVVKTSHFTATRWPERITAV